MSNSVNKPPLDSWEYQLNKAEAQIVTNQGALAIASAVLQIMREQKVGPKELAQRLNEKFGQGGHEILVEQVLEGDGPSLGLLQLTMLGHVLGTPLIAPLDYQATKAATEEAASESSELGEFNGILEAIRARSKKRNTRFRVDENDHLFQNAKNRYEAGTLNPECCADCRSAFDYFESQKTPDPTVGLRPEEIAEVQEEVKAEMAQPTPPPKFSVGDEVDYSAPEVKEEFGCQGTIRERYYGSHGEYEATWNYKITGQPDDRSWPEYALRPAIF